MHRISASLVVYNTPPDELGGLLTALGSAGLQAWVVVDNGASANPAYAFVLRSMVEEHGGRYMPAPRNLGFGAGHNLALRALAKDPTDFHVLVNPDILFTGDVLPGLAQVMEEHPSAALIMPRVVFPDGSPQYLCRLLPTPLDFALRRFAPGWLQQRFQQRMDRYELRGIEDMPCDRVPFLSGCFLFTRRGALEAAGGFDERYFLYMEDVDLCRRLAARATLLYWPGIRVVHGCYRGAYRDRWLLWIFVRSAARYFARWGWIFDPQRRAANRAALACLHSREGIHLPQTKS